MTEQQDLVDLINETPNSELFAFMLTDWLIEHKDMIPSEARRHVQNVVMVATAALDAYRAGLMLSHGTSSRPVLVKAIREWLQTRDADHAVVIMIPGHQAPQLTTYRQWEDGSSDYHRQVTVGGGWLMRTWLASPESSEPRQMPPREKKRRK